MQNVTEYLTRGSDSWETSCSEKLYVMTIFDI